MRRAFGKLALGAFQSTLRVRDKLHSLVVGSAFRGFGKRSVLSMPARLAGVENIEVGERVFFGPGCWLQTLSREGHAAPRLIVGSGTCVSGTAVLSAASEVVLEDEVLLARNVYVSDHIHRYDDLTRPILAQGVDKVQAVRICRGAWLGQNVVVCPGVTIGKGSVIGANSVVTRDIPDYCVAVGAPAKVVKRFGPDESERDAARQDAELSVATH